ncbi:MAG: hypothetical protein WC700_09135 [Gemmatimonadaceae bacterium]
MAAPKPPIKKPGRLIHPAPPSREALAAYREMQRATAARLRRIAEQGAVKRMRGVYERGYAEMLAKLKATIRAGKSETFTGLQQRAILAQLRQGVVKFGGQLQGVLAESMTEARLESVRAVASDIERLTVHFKGAAVAGDVDAAAIHAGATEAHRASRMRAPGVKSLARYGSDLVAKIEDEMSMSALQGETVGDAIQRIETVGDLQWWQAERVARTEAAYAASTSTIDGVEAAAGMVPGLTLRWTEYVDDASGQGLDERVSVDSLAIHGQIRSKDGMWTMPDSSPVPDAKGLTEVHASLAGKTFTSAPCRPNGRETLVPWHPDWGIPGWYWIGGERVPATRTV